MYYIFIQNHDVYANIIRVWYNIMGCGIFALLWDSFIRWLFLIINFCAGYTLPLARTYCVNCQLIVNNGVGLAVALATSGKSVNTKKR